MSRTIAILLEVRGLFRPVPYLAFPLYLNSISGNGTETRDTISAGDSINYTVLLNRIYHEYDGQCEPYYLLYILNIRSSYLFFFTSLAISTAPKIVRMISFFMGDSLEFIMPS